MKQKDFLATPSNSKQNHSYYKLDLCLHFKEKKYPIELKLRYGEKTYTEGKKQLSDYMDKLGCSEGWLIVFDRRKTVSWDKKIFWQTKEIAEKTIHVVGC